MLSYSCFTVVQTCQGISPDKKELCKNLQSRGLLRHSTQYRNRAVCQHRGAAAAPGAPSPRPAPLWAGSATAPTPSSHKEQRQQLEGPDTKRNRGSDTHCLEKIKSDTMQLVFGCYLVCLSFSFWPLTLCMYGHASCFVSHPNTIAVITL